MLQEKEVKKLTLVLTNFTLVITAKKEAHRNAETNKTGENSENGKNGDKDKNLGTNFIQISYIQYFITF